MAQTVAVVGGTGYTGKEIVKLLLDERKYEVKVLTGHPTRPHPFGDRIKVLPLRFELQDLREALRGVRCLYNTYWVRFKRGNVSFEDAVSNTKKMFEAALLEGVDRVVHISITNPSKDSPYGYFRGKAILEEHLVKSGLSYAIVRPTVVFGLDDILINNMAWIIRKFRFFPVFGSGQYKITPVYVGDVASTCVDFGESSDNAAVDCVGPETYTFKGLLEAIAGALGVKAAIFSSPKRLAFGLGALLSFFLGEPIVTREEVGALMDNLLYSSAKPLGQTKLSEWLHKNSYVIGQTFASELERHYR